MISLETAIENAKEFAKKITGKTLNNITIEEVDLDEYKEYWLITLGWDDKPMDLTALEIAAGVPRGMSRKYKTFYIDVDSGDIKKMKEFE